MAERAKSPQEEPFQGYEGDTKVFYDLFVKFFEIVLHVFFNTVKVRGAWRVPKTGPVILVGAPHASQFVDPVLLGVEVRKMIHRRPSFLIAEKSHAHPIIGRLSRLMNAIPVGRAQDSFHVATGEVYAKPQNTDPENQLVIRGIDTLFLKEVKPGMNISLQGFNDLAPVEEVRSDTELVLRKPFKTTECQQMMVHGFEPCGYKIGAKVDNSKMFHSVFDHLATGGSIGIFPEGGSHDRTEMLPLKPGVAIMALGTMAAYPGSKVAIVPVGMNYFHPHKFRSRAVIEFGDPLYVDDDLLKEYTDGGVEGKKSSVAELMARIVDRLQLVTINAPDYETLMVIQAGQRLYLKHRHIPLSLTIEFRRRFVQGYLSFKEKDPRINELYQDVKRYNDQLTTMGIADHQVAAQATVSKLRILRRLLTRVLILIVLVVAGLPGLILSSPILAGTKLYSKRKARLALAKSNVKIQANDVIATWKILVGLFMVPTIFGAYSIGCCYYVFTRTNWLPYGRVNLVRLFFACFYGLMLVGYATIIISEAGRDIFKSLRPLYLALSPSRNDSLVQIRKTRADLQTKITAVVNELGPQLFPDIKYRLNTEEPYRNVSQDPRIDIRGLNSSLNLKGDYDLANVAVFSAEQAPLVLGSNKVRRRFSGTRKDQ